MVLVGRKTGRVADRAVDIDGRVALAANEVVMVVADARFIERGATRRFDAAEDTGSDKGVQIIKNGLPRKAGEAVPRRSGDEVGVLVLSLVLNSLQHRQPLGRDPQVGVSK